MRFASAVIAFVVFIAIYAVLARRGGGQIQWGWLAAVLLCAGVALVLSFVM